MKGQLYIQRNKGKLLKNISPRHADINGGENKHDRKIYAQDGNGKWLIGEMFVTDMVIGADGIMFKGYEEEGDRVYRQEWWVEINGNYIFNSIKGKMK